MEYKNPYQLVRDETPMWEWIHLVDRNYRRRKLVALRKVMKERELKVLNRELAELDKIVAALVADEQGAGLRGDAERFEAAIELARTLAVDGVDPVESADDAIYAIERAWLNLIAGVADVSLHALLSERARELQARRNLRPNASIISDDRILAVLKDSRYKTRARQAKALGFRSVRSLHKRLKKLRDDGKLR